MSVYRRLLDGLVLDTFISVRCRSSDINITKVCIAMNFYNVYINCRDICHLATKINKIFLSRPSCSKVTITVKMI